jgi:endo-1,4-beta-D-glucanase Y
MTGRATCRSSPRRSPTVSPTRRTACRPSTRSSPRPTRPDKELWDNAYTAGEKLLQNAANPQTGLAPDYANFDGTPYLTAANTPTDDDTAIPSGYAHYYDGMLYMLGLLYDSGSFRIWWSPTDHRHPHALG